MQRKYFPATIFLVLVLSACLKDEAIKLKIYSNQPSEIYDGWMISSPSEEFVSEEAIEKIYRKFFSEDEYYTAISLLIAKNEKLISEAYCRDINDRDHYHQTQSVTKSITSLVFGIAVDHGYFPNLDSAICDYFPEYFASDAKREITIRHLLTMKAGLEFENSTDSEQMINYASNSLAFVINKPLLYQPGKKFIYNDGCPQLISALIQKQTGLSMAEFAHKYLFAPLGVENYKWDNHKDGITYGANNLWLTPRDLLKIGQLIVNAGVWNNTQIISKAWIEESTSIHNTPSGIGSYGYYWYIRPDNNAIVASGIGGQYIYIMPDKNLVLVFTAEPYTNPLISNFIWDLEGEIIGLLD